MDDPYDSVSTHCDDCECPMCEQYFRQMYVDIDVETLSEEDVLRKDDWIGDVTDKYYYENEEGKKFTVTFDD